MKSITSSIEYILVNFKMMILYCGEYPANTITQIISQIIYLGVYFIFFEIISMLVSGINYSKIDLLIYLILIDLCVTFSGIFDWGKSLKYHFINGKLNIYLTKPKNIFLLYQFSKQNSNAFIQHVTGWIVLIYLLLNFDTNFQFNSVVILSLMLIVLFYTSIKFFTSAISFFNFALSEILYTHVFRAGSSSFKQYPAQFFEFFPYKRLLIIFPMYFMGALVFEYSLFENLIIELLFSLIILNIVFSTFTIILWKKGLKKYEAYG